MRQCRSTTAHHLRTLTYLCPLQLAPTKANPHPINRNSLHHRTSLHTPTNPKMSSTTPLSHQHCLTLLRQAAPPLDGSTYKGQSGKLAIIGGSPEYTGAPYFAAMSAMRAGAELCFVYSHPSAAPAIKAYSPDLIVYPGFDFLGTHCESLDRMHAIVLGPGLGRGESAGAVVHKVIRYASREKKPLVIDADALWFVSQQVELRRIIRDAGGGFVAFLTPNKVEMDRLMSSGEMKSVGDVVDWFNGRIVLVQKGKVDVVSGFGNSLQVANCGALKRVGGQGDFLAGLIALCAAWLADESMATEGFGERSVAAAVCACVITRDAARRAFERHGRGLLASDIFPFVGPAMEEVLKDGHA